MARRGLEAADGATPRGMGGGSADLGSKSSSCPIPRRDKDSWNQQTVTTMSIKDAYPLLVYQKWQPC
jgi:hypothetical protein